ncbi:Arginase family protein [Hymenobacter daecheongensis DSM 21074]|uniref:Arginase family protein n=1 Tax=Hymenobacter daecheongensis DSM 21074 TaxID=1121955 RepID=A0A1M6A2C0_9BACT|nr:formimidoylglutamase [Hymenobacter daecheongensis]SHI30610.1 Arginase family protein [Hymenobacter daecheongensis DSM 21074]
MNLAIFFDPLPEELTAPAAASTTLANYATRFQDTFPDWRTADLALIGLDEWRGSAAGAPAQHGADEVRRRFYQLQKGTGSLRLVDLGNLRPGLTLEDTYLRLREIIGTLLEHNTVPILLGGSHDLDYGQFLAYENLDRPVSFATVDSHVDMAEHDTAAPEAAHLRRILMHEPSFLFNFAQLAHQQYLVAADVLAALEKLHFETLRLGQVRDDIRQAEPLLRQADFVSFDVAALRWNDAPAYYPANPFGLTNEEAAKLAWYAGHNDQLSSFGLYGYRPCYDQHGLAASTLATMLWYFVEGFYHRRGETDFQSRRFTRYAVGLPGSPAKLVFYKAKRTEKWWLEVESMANSDIKRIVPCSYEDYFKAAQGDLPNRWILTQALLG